MKVAVIADDLSGAAELAAAAADMGYCAEVHTRFDPASRAEVVALDTDSRAMPAADAASVVEKLTRELVRAGPVWVYKKTDSVLRGNVRAEIEAVMTATATRRALLVPANPSKGRTIRNGVYYVGGAPLQETAFAADPDHPRRSSAVAELLGKAGASRGDDGGIGVPDVEDSEVVVRLARNLDRQTLAAGGVEFFRGVLELWEGKRRVAAGTSAVGRPALLVCGSAHAWGQGRSTECESHGVPVLAMPDSARSAVHPGSGAVLDWPGRIAGALAARGCAMVAIGRVGSHESYSSRLVVTLAQAISAALGSVSVSTLCVEGGATAAAVLREFGWTRLAALPSSDVDGVAMLRPIDRVGPLVLVKPGSYPWPKQLWRQLADESG